MKKTLVLLTIGATLLVNTSFASFKDINTNDWYYDAVQYVSENNILNGTGEDLFSPSENMTRAMIVQALYNMEENPEFQGDNIYEDVEAGKWYENAIIWSSKNNIVSGVDENLFAPNTLITREQMVTILHNYAKYKGYDVSIGEDTNILSYNDAFELSEYAYSPMQWACGAQIIKGYEGNLLPKNNLTRAEFATIIYNFYSYYPRYDLGWVELKGNPTTGYTWTATGYDEEIVKVYDCTYSQEGDSDLVGQGGTFKFKLKSLKPGVTTVTFKYMRPWEEEAITTIVCEILIDENNYLQISRI